MLSPRSQEPLFHAMEACTLFTHLRLLHSKLSWFTSLVLFIFPASRSFLQRTAQNNEQWPLTNSRWLRVLAHELSTTELV